MFKHLVLLFINKRYSKNLTKAIMKRSWLKTEANRSKDPVDIVN